MKIKESAEAGKSAYAIGKEMGISKNTARKYMQPGVAPPEKNHRPSKLDAYKPLLHELMADGIYNCVVLLERLREAGYDGGISILHAFSYLWLRGCSPEITYRTEHWHSVKTVEDAADWYINRSKLQKDLTSGEEQAVRAYLHSISENGMVTETTSTTIITMLWHI